MDNSNYWPYTNIHELNLDWIISKVKELDTRFTDDIETFVREYIDEHFAEWTVNANYDPDDETIIYTNGTGATLTAGDVIRFAIDNAFVNVKDPTARTAASAAQTTANNAVTAAAAAQSTADTVKLNLETAIANINEVEQNLQAHVSALDTKLNINSLKLYINNENATSYTISDLPHIGDSNKFKYALLWGGTGSYHTFLYFLFIDTQSQVTQIDISEHLDKTLTYEISNGNLIITSSDIMYGGIRLLWLN